MGCRNSRATGTDESTVKVNNANSKPKNPPKINSEKPKDKPVKVEVSNHESKKEASNHKQESKEGTNHAR